MNVSFSKTVCECKLGEFKFGFLKYYIADILWFYVTYLQWKKSLLNKSRGSIRMNFSVENIVAGELLCKFYRNIMRLTKLKLYDDVCWYRWASEPTVIKIMNFYILIYKKAEHYKFIFTVLIMHKNEKLLLKKWITNLILFFLKVFIHYIIFILIT